MRLAPSVLVCLSSLAFGGCTLTVDSTLDGVDADPGDGVCADARDRCTLRAAVMEAGASGASYRIAIPAGHYRLDLGGAAGGELLVERSMRLQGAGAGATVIDAEGSSRVVRVSGGDPVQLQSLTLTGGDAQYGGGVWVDEGARVLMQDVELVDNEAFTGGGALVVIEGATVEGDRIEFAANHAVGAFGGAVYNAGRLVLRASLFHDNESNRAGALHNGGSGSLNLFDVTMSGNRGRSNGRSVGGMLNLGFAVLRNVTLSDNEGGGETGAGGLQMTDSSTTVLKNTLLANNVRRAGAVSVGSDCKGTLSTDSRYNLIEVRDDCILPAATSTYVLDTDARLAPLADNGGATRTHRLRADSPAMDAGFPFPPGSAAADACRARDQRGVPRPQTLPSGSPADTLTSAPDAGRCDIGAYEAGNLDSFVTRFTLVDAGDDTDIGPLRNGDVLLLDDLPERLSVRADTTRPDLVGSVSFGYDDDPLVRIENIAPYAIAGDSSGDYAAFDFGENGEHTLTATPHGGADASGAGGGAATVTLTVIGGD